MIFWRLVQWSGWRLGPECYLITDHGNLAEVSWHDKSEQSTQRRQTESLYRNALGTRSFEKKTLKSSKNILSIQIKNRFSGRNYRHKLVLSVEI